jgi:hypothetical protein
VPGRNDDAGEERATVSEFESAQRFTRLDIGVVIALVAMGIAGVVGLIAVLDAGTDVGAFGIGFGGAVSIFQAGATIACALACLARRRLEAISIGALVAAGLSVDLFLLAIWLGIEDETYGKLVGIAFIWAFFALLVLGLALAAQPRDRLARSLYLAAIGASLLGGILASALVLTSGDAAILAPAPSGLTSIADESLLRPLGAVLVVLGSLWFAALATSRVARNEEP